jgi:hypothetical protein
MSYLRYLCFCAHSGVQHILCCVFVVFPRLVQPMLTLTNFITMLYRLHISMSGISNSQV